MESGPAQTHAEMRRAMQAQAIPKIAVKNRAIEKLISMRRRESKRRGAPHEPQFQRAQIHARQSHRFAPTGWPQFGQQWFASVFMMCRVFNISYDRVKYESGLGALGMIYLRFDFMVLQGNWRCLVGEGLAGGTPALPGSVFPCSAPVFGNALRTASTHRGIILTKARNFS